MPISQKVKDVIIRNPRYTIFLYGDEYIARFSYLHQCTFKEPIKI